MIQTGIFSVVVGSLILLYACYSDLKSRSVANEVWLFMIGAGIPLALYNVFLDGIPYLRLMMILSHKILLSVPYPLLSSFFPSVLLFSPSLLRLNFSIGLTFLLAYLFFYFGLFGGADAKALIGIAILIPMHPLNASLIVDPLPFAITTLFNGAIISGFLLVILLPSMFFLNLSNLDSKEFRDNRGLALIGYKMNIEALTKPKYKILLRLLHSYDEEGEADGGTIKRNFIIGGIEIDDEVLEQLKKYHLQGKIGEDVWVTPGLPYMLFITAGFFITLFYGNLILLILTTLVPL
ncbi:MAG TPA: A24 family peptidase C-terminal domain-containing protein [Desulfobacteria bacterium]|nr:A24 family peptidase C-terminal domain-containing protein [Desulfobacteria bacterium]